MPEIEPVNMFASVTTLPSTPPKLINAWRGRRVWGRRPISGRAYFALHFSEDVVRSIRTSCADSRYIKRTAGSLLTAPAGLQFYVAVAEGRAAPNENPPPLPKITATVVHHNRRVTSKCCTGQSSAPLNSGHSDLLGSILPVINTPTRDKRSLYITMHLTCGIGGSTEHSCNKSVRVDIYHRVAGTCNITVNPTDPSCSSQAGMFLSTRLVVPQSGDLIHYDGRAFGDLLAHS
ncbi:hypothetical protein Bbelb_321240 [Branchiostoma belcheri]|nr:hypothetical protein Bbelb_321240 [Branchiostoma belcheri]